MKASLWNRSRKEAIPELKREYIDQLDFKGIVRSVRLEARATFPEVKFSVTKAGHNSMYAHITAAPYPKESAQLMAIAEWLCALADSYNYCACYDPYGDYGSTPHFYGPYVNNVIYYDMELLEAGPEVLADMADYEKQAAKYEADQEAAREVEYKKAVERRAAAAIESANYNKSLLIAEGYVLDHVTYNDIPEADQEIIPGVMYANMNKNNTLEEYEEEVESGKFNRTDTKITRNIIFDDLKAYQDFTGLFLHDFEFIKGTGGSYTDDPRIETMQDYHAMTREERDTVKWLNYGAAVYLNDDIKFVIDAQGFGYARYVGLLSSLRVMR